MSTGKLETGELVTPMWRTMEHAAADQANLTMDRADVVGGTPYTGFKMSWSF